MESGVMTGTKECCRCGRNVNGAKRMKDSEGRYWCIPCGEADKQARLRNAGGICAACGENYSIAAMTQLHGKPHCDRCLKRIYQKDRHGMGTRGGGPSLLQQLRDSLSGSGEGPNKKLLILLGVLAVVSGLMWYLGFWQ